MYTFSEQYQETKKHGSTLFPFNIYPCTIPLDFPTVALHWHQSMELIYIKKGRGLVQIHLEMMEAKSGDIFIIPPGTLHAMRGLTGHSMEYENFIFDVSFLGSGAADICAQEYLVPLAVGQLPLPLLLQKGTEGYEKVAACLKETENLCEERVAGYELGVKAAMLRLLFLLLGQCPKPLHPDSLGPESASDSRLKSVLRLIEAEYSQPLSVARAAADCSLSPSHFMRWFKQKTGSSFTAYLNERRLAAAAEMLRRNDDTILSVAEQAGFENLSNFNRQFKARYGVSPRQYRSRTP